MTLFWQYPLFYTSSKIDVFRKTMPEQTPHRFLTAALDRTVANQLREYRQPSTQRRYP